MTCCSDANDVTPCCDCNAKGDACVPQRVVDEERSTRKRSSWTNTELTQHSSRATFFLVAAVFVAVIVGFGIWRRCRRRHDTKRRFRFGRDGRRTRVAKSPQNSFRPFDPGYEKLPLTDANGRTLVDDDADDFSSSSDDDVYLRPTLNGDAVSIRDERRRLVTSNDASSSTIEI